MMMLQSLITVSRSTNMCITHIRSVRSHYGETKPHTTCSEIFVGQYGRDHPATIKDIAAYLEGLDIMRQGNHLKDIDELIEIGIDIDCKNERNTICISLMYVSLNLRDKTTC